MRHQFPAFVLLPLSLFLLLSSNPITYAAASVGDGLTQTETTAFSVVAYLPEWRYEGADFATIADTVTHLLLFSLEPTAQGGIAATDRLPRPTLLAEARQETASRGCRLMLCFGGNGRSSGFQGMVRRPEARKRFVAALMVLLEKHRLDGVDYNWEYPGYDFRSGYSGDREVEADYAGLAALVKETRTAFKARQRAVKKGNGTRGWYPDSVTLAYYPDGRQERLLAHYGLLDPQSGAHLVHAMAYDTRGNGGHSSLAFSRQCLHQAAQLLPGKEDAQGNGAGHMLRMTLGLPFYGRFLSTGDWRSYEDILVHINGGQALPPGRDTVDDASSGGLTLAFNGVQTIRAKVRAAVQAGAGGVMIWEVGQDCRRRQVRRKDRTAAEGTHVVTCPGDSASLLAAIHEELQALGVPRLVRSPVSAGSRTDDKEEL